mgnify:CR=1 FL=1
MRYKTKTQQREEYITSDDILSQKEERLLIEKIQQRNWESAGRDWKKYLSNVEWDEVNPFERKKVEKQSENHPFEKFI